MGKEWGWRAWRAKTIRARIKVQGAKVMRARAAFRREAVKLNQPALTVAEQQR